MPVSFHIFKERGLVYVRYEGFATPDESLTAFGEYAQHPDCRPGQKQIVDFSKVTGFSNDFVKLMELQANKAEVFMGHGEETLIVYLATNEMTLTMARTVEKSWEPFPSVVPIVLQNEADSLALLGQPERSFADLLQAAT